LLVEPNEFSSFHNFFKFYKAHNMRNSMPQIHKQTRNM